MHLTEKQLKKNRERMKAWRIANPGGAAERSRKWRAANPEKVKAWAEKNREKTNRQSRAAYAANPEGRKKATMKWASKNRERTNETQRRYCQRNREKIRVRDWERKLRNYGISGLEYDVMLKEQNGVCKICGTIGDSRRLAVDHHHESGTVRGLICHPCNTALGLVKEDVFVLQKMINYLQET